VPQVERALGRPVLRDRVVDAAQDLGRARQRLRVGMPAGISAWCSSPGSTSWKLAIIERIGWPFWYACVRRVENERPSWMRSTEKVIGCSSSPGRRKYPCIE